MKNLKFIKAAFFSLFLVFLLSSCDPCKDVTCLNGGTCIEGTCECADGYEGDDCGTLSRTKFVGNYTANSDCVTGGGFSVSVTASSQSDTEVEIENIFKLKDLLGVTDLVSGTVLNNSLTIPSQSITVSGAQWTVSGSGSYESANSISVDYVVTDQFGNDNTCSESWSK